MFSAGNVFHLFLQFDKRNMIEEFDYRTRANKGRSRLVAASLTFQAKKRFLCLFYVII